MVAVCLCAAASGCEPGVSIGAKFCDEPPTDGGVNPVPDVWVPMPWTTGFEDGMCGYATPTGFCFTTGGSSFDIVTSPVHSGRYAAAYTVNSDFDGGSQARCVQQGALPKAAYYSAWYYLPAAAENSGNWNLIFFQGAHVGQSLKGKWSVSLVNRGDNELHVVTFNAVAGAASDAGTTPSIPIGEWFQLKAFYKQADDDTGELSVWQDDIMVSHFTGAKASDELEWGQWYVGNLANALVPPSSTLYVDDVSIRPAP